MGSIFFSPASARRKSPTLIENERLQVALSQRIAVNVNGPLEATE